MKYDTNFQNFIKGRADLNKHMIKRIGRLVQDIRSEETPWQKFKLKRAKTVMLSDDTLSMEDLNKNKLQRQKSFN